MSDNMIRVSAVPQWHSTAEQDIAAVAAQTGDPATFRDIESTTARAIASWYQSSGSVGSVLASFASGREVDRSALLNDISATVFHDFAGEWPMELELLCTFVINYGREN